MWVPDPLKCSPSLTLTVVLCFHTKYSYWLSNGIGIVKLLTLLFISITGLVVLGGHTKVQDPNVNFKQPFTGKITPYGATTALYRIIFPYAGYENSFNVVNEVKVRNTREGHAETLKKADHTLESNKNNQEERICGIAACHYLVYPS